MNPPRRASLDVALLPEHVTTPSEDPGSSSPPVAVVVDVLRASTTMACALAAGSDGIRPCAEIDEARSLAAQIPGSLLCGERGGVAPEGFDLGNSPLEYTPERVSGRRLVMSTTNGTRAVGVVRGSHTVLIGSIVNASATAARAAELGGDLTIVCAGTDGRVSLDDTVGAGLIARRVLELDPEREVRDGALVALGVTDRVTDDASCLACVSEAKHARTLLGLGRGEDIAFACSIDRVPVVPVYDASSGVIVPG